MCLYYSNEYSKAQWPLLLSLAHQHLEVSGVWSQDVRLPWVHDSLAQTACQFYALF